MGTQGLDTSTQALLSFLQANTDDLLSGAGWDEDWVFKQLANSTNSLEATTLYHYMNGENGMYYGWVSFWLNIAQRSSDSSFFIVFDGCDKPQWWGDKWEDEDEPIHPDFEQFTDDLLNEAHESLTKLLERFNKDVLPTIS